MKLFRSFVSSLLLISVPAMTLPKLPEEKPKPISYDPFFQLTENPTTYDQLLAYIDQVENGEFDHLNPLEIEWLQSLMIRLAQAGLLEEDGDEVEELFADIDELKAEDFAYTFAYQIDGVTVTPY